MADWLKTIKNVMDAHGAWVFGGAVAAGLVAHQARKRRSFDADWFSVTCYGCGRSGFSDEMARVTAPDGRDAYRCVRCDRPDVFMQAEGDDECTCDDLPDDHPDWMKGMCESCYDRWASAWSSKGAEATNACPHCEGAAGFPREFYYQSDRIDMVPCGTCLTQGRCPGCMEIYPGLTRDNTPEDVFFNTGCTRCGYSESDARAARKTARRWVELVDNPAAAKFMAEDYSVDQLANMQFNEIDRLSGFIADRLNHTQESWSELSVDDRKEILNKIKKDEPWMSWSAEDDLEICNVCGDRTHTDTVEIQVCDKHTASDYGLFYPDYWEGDAEGDHSTGSLGARVRNIIMALREMADNDDPDYTEVYNGWADTIEELLNQRTRSAEDYGVGAVWMAERYDPNTHGAFLPAGSVKRFLSTIPLRTPFFVEFQKSNGDLRSMNAIFTKPFDADGMAAGVLEVFPGDSSKRSSFKRFRVDRVVTLYRI